MTTALDLITLSLKDLGALGIGQSIQPDDIADGLTTLNQMLGQWQAERLSVFHEIESVTQATGSASYSVGPGGDFNIARPTDIKAAFVRLKNASLPVDYPVMIIRSREDYSKIGVKGITTLPDSVYYDAAYPLGKLLWYPVPQSQYELHIVVLDTLQMFSTPSTAINLPLPYHVAIRFNLAVYLAPLYQMMASSDLMRLAANAKRVVKRMNVQIPAMTLPSEFAGSGGRYNIASDGYTR